MKSKDQHPRLLYPARLSFKIERDIKGFPDKKEGEEEGRRKRRRRRRRKSRRRRRRKKRRKGTEL